MNQVFQVFSIFVCFLPQSLSTESKAYSCQTEREIILIRFDLWFKLKFTNTLPEDFIISFANNIMTSNNYLISRNYL